MQLQMNFLLSPAPLATAGSGEIARWEAGWRRHHSRREGGGLPLRVGVAELRNPGGSGCLISCCLSLGAHGIWAISGNLIP